ncbi:unnamed protein product, partial [Effrenium voratum]
VGAGAQDWSVTTDVECMGPGPSSDPSYYTLHNPITAEQDCKDDLCLADSACVGIEFSSMFMNCEVWTSPIDTTLPGVGYSCYVLLPSTTTSSASTSVTATSTATQTTSETSTQTSTLTSTISSTLTFTSTWTFTSTSTLTNTQTATSTLTSSVTATLTTSLTATSTSTATSTATGTFTTTDTATTTATATVTATRTVTETSTATATATTTGTTAARRPQQQRPQWPQPHQQRPQKQRPWWPQPQQQRPQWPQPRQPQPQLLPAQLPQRQLRLQLPQFQWRPSPQAQLLAPPRRVLHSRSRTATLCLQNGTDWQCQETTSESEVSLAERELELLRMLRRQAGHHLPHLSSSWLCRGFAVEGRVQTIWRWKWRRVQMRHFQG